MRPIHCPLLALLLMVSGCNSGGTSLNDLATPAVDDVSAQSIGDESSTMVIESIETTQPDNDLPTELTTVSDPLDVDTMDDNTASSPSVEADNGTVPVDTFALSLDQSRATLEEGDRDGVTIVIEVSPDGDESIDLLLDPENPVDALGIEVSLDQQRLDSQDPSTTITFTMPVGMQPRLEHQRTFIVRATSGDETRTQTIMLDIKPVNAPDVYLLIGQSNMVGSSEEDAKQTTSGGADEQDSRIRQLNVSHNNRDLYSSRSDFSRDANIAVEPRFIEAQDPLHEPLRINRDEKSGTKVGSGMSFAKAALGDTTQEIYLVPAAWGSSGFCDALDGQLAWNAEESNNTALGGSGLLERAIARLNLTLEGTGGVFRGILWHQGEADSTNRTCADSYAQNIALMVERIRTDVTEDPRGESARGPEAPVPFIVGTMSMGEDSRGDFSNWSDSKEQVDGVHRQISELVPFADWVNNDDLVPLAYPCGSGSCVHFGSLAIREMGQRYFEALERVWERQ